MNMILAVVKKIIFITTKAISNGFCYGNSDRICFTDAAYFSS